MSHENQYKLMFNYHRKFAWFTEKYDMSDRFVDMRERVRKDGLKGTINQFIIELEAGLFDPSSGQSSNTAESRKYNRDDGDGNNSVDVEPPNSATLNPN